MPVGIAFARARPGQLFQMRLHAQARGRRVDRILIAQLVEGEAAGVGDLEGARQRLGMACEQARHLGARLEMALGIGDQTIARLVDRAVLADAGEHVLERPPRGRVVEHVASGHERRAAGISELGQRLDARAVVAAIEVLRGKITRARNGSS